MQEAMHTHIMRYGNVTNPNRTCVCIQNFPRAPTDGLRRKTAGSKVQHRCTVKTRRPPQASGGKRRKTTQNDGTKSASTLKFDHLQKLHPLSHSDAFGAFWRVLAHSGVSCRTLAQNGAKQKDSNGTQLMYFWFNGSILDLAWGGRMVRRHAS